MTAENRVCPSHGRFPGGCCPLCGWFYEMTDYEKLAKIIANTPSPKAPEPLASKERLKLGRYRDLVKCGSSVGGAALSALLDEIDRLTTERDQARTDREIIRQERFRECEGLRSQLRAALEMWTIYADAVERELKRRGVKTMPPRPSFPRN